MKIRLTIFLALAISLFMVGCKGNSNTNVNVVATPTPVVKTTETVKVDATMVTKLQDAYKAKGFTDITVTTDPATGQMVLRGSVAKDKLAEAMQIANEITGKPPKNELSVK